jgi:enoyl-CoA hydratase/carnithine racemase
VADYQDIVYDKQGNVVTITLNRPQALNAISPQMEAEWHAALDEADADDEVRAIIVTGAGRAFSSGYDLSGRPGADDNGPMDPKGQSIASYLKRWATGDLASINKLLHFWYVSKPIIIAVNGYAMGGGFWYVTASDITIASDRAVFAQPEVRHVSNTTFLFAYLCGWKVANRYGLTGDHFDAQEALRIGLVNEVVPHDQLMERAMALAKRLALVPEPSVRYNKYVSMLGLEAAGVRAGMLVNAGLSALAHSSHNEHREALFRAQQEGGMRRFLEVRDGPFGRDVAAGTRG